MTKSALLLFSLLIAMPLAFLEAGKKATSSDAADESKRNTTIFEIEGSLDQARDAALLALAKVGCKIKKDSGDQIEGKRPNKIGLAVGSGGEKLFVSFKDLGNNRLEITVRTKKTAVGMVGQKLWNEEVAEEIRNALS